jgi:hypothetical protein
VQTANAWASQPPTGKFTFAGGLGESIVPGFMAEHGLETEVSPQPRSEPVEPSSQPVLKRSKSGEVLADTVVEAGTLVMLEHKPS